MKTGGVSMSSVTVPWSAKKRMVVALYRMGIITVDDALTFFNNEDSIR